MLKFLFVARFKDGSEIHQDQDDVSTIDPLRSQFYDVLQRQDDLVSFGLHSIESPDSYAVVNLEEGSITTYNISSVVQDEDDVNVYRAGAKYRVVFFRRHNVNHVEDRITAYMLGWQTTVDGKNYQRTILFN